MAHIHERIDFTASVFIVQDNRVLMHLHKKTGKWLQPGGHIELDEDPNQAAIREAKEETGFDIELIGGTQLPHLRDAKSDIVPPKFLNRHHFNETHEHVDCVYFARIIDGELTPEEGVDIRWFSREELDSISLPSYIRAYALQALEEVK